MKYRAKGKITECGIAKESLIAWETHKNKVHAGRSRTRQRNRRKLIATAFEDNRNGNDDASIKLATALIMEVVNGKK